MNYAKAVKKTNTMGITEKYNVEEFGLSVGALWGDIEEGLNRQDYKAFYLESAQKKVHAKEQQCAQAMAEEPMRAVKEAERIKEQSERKEILRARASRACCKSCNKFLVHSDPPRPEVVGLCCAYCGQTGGKGHWGACQQHIKKNIKRGTKNPHFFTCI